MFAEGRSAPVTVGLFRRVLDVGTDEPLRDVVRAARTWRGHVAPLVLSAAEAEGIALGTGSGDELRRMGARVEDYRRLADRLTGAVPGARVLKGPALGRHWPAALLRPCGDLDVCVPDAAALWRAVREVAALRPLHDLDVTVLRHGDVLHWVVVLRWQAEDPVLDVDHRIELATFAYPGHPGVVDIRTEPPGDQAVADLLALAEERFDRPFGPKDLLDLAFVLRAADCPPLPELAFAAELFRLAPELRELAERVRGVADLTCPANERLLALLEGPAERERAARAAQSLPDAELPLHGFRLTETVHVRRSDTVEFVGFDGGTVLRCPVGDFLLVDSDRVDPDVHDAALAAVGTPEDVERSTP
ncbi:hypothetical protein [Kitasatospora sp. NPDC050543]|uniref:hypothetical protein n=1 Tax=Kitasatospora sp. NPDC050543 TaxID=3364054 RepID=UPI0037877289